MTRRTNKFTTVTIALILLASLLLVAYYYVKSQDSTSVTSAQAQFDITYTVHYVKEENTSFLAYELIVENLSNHPLYNFDAEISLADEMHQYTPINKMGTAPLKMLSAPLKDSDDNVIVFSQMALLLEYDNLTVDEMKELDTFYADLSVKLSWKGGSKEFKLTKVDLAGDSTLTLL